MSSRTSRELVVTNYPLRFMARMIYIWANGSSQLPTKRDFERYSCVKLFLPNLTTDRLEVSMWCWAEYPLLVHKRRGHVLFSRKHALRNEHQELVAQWHQTMVYMEEVHGKPGPKFR